MSTLSLRLPNSLHERLRELAAREGISINQLITLAAAEKVSSILTLEHLAERARAADLAAFDRLLARVPPTPPLAGDELPADQVREPATPYATRARPKPRKPRKR